MLYNAEMLSERLTQYAKDYKQGLTQDFEQIFKDCEVAANMIKNLKSSKQTYKRKAQRLQRRNEELRAKTEQLESAKNFAYAVILDKEPKEKITVVNKDKIERIKKELESLCQ